LAYTGFLACLELQPEEASLRFDLAKIDLGTRALRCRHGSLECRL
jgi:hypothetical protein